MNEIEELTDQGLLHRIGRLLMKQLDKQLNMEEMTQLRALNDEVVKRKLPLLQEKIF